MKISHSNHREVYHSHKSYMQHEEAAPSFKVTSFADSSMVSKSPLNSPPFGQYFFHVFPTPHFFQPRICLVPNDPPQFLESKDGFQVAYAGRHVTVLSTVESVEIFRDVFGEESAESTWKAPEQKPLQICSGNFNGLSFNQRIANSQKDCLST